MGEREAIRARWERAQEALKIGFGTDGEADSARNKYLRWALAHAPTDIAWYETALAAAEARAEASDELAAVLQGRVDMLETWVAVLSDALTAYMEPAGDTPEELREQARRALAGGGA